MWSLSFLWCYPNSKHLSRLASVLRVLPTFTCRKLSPLSLSVAARPGWRQAERREKGRMPDACPEFPRHIRVQTEEAMSQRESRLC